MEVGLQQIDTSFLIFLVPFTTLDIKCHQKATLSLDEIPDLQVQNTEVSDAIGVVQAFLVLFVDVEGAGIGSDGFVPLSDLEVTSAQTAVNVR